MSEISQIKIKNVNYDIKDATAREEIEELKNTSLPIASTTTLGGIKIDGDTITISEDGTISSSSNDDTKMDKINPTGSGSLSIGRKENSTIGEGSHVLGYLNTNEISLIGLSPASTDGTSQLYIPLSTAIDPIINWSSTSGTITFDETIKVIVQKSTFVYNESAKAIGGTITIDSASSGTLSYNSVITSVAGFTITEGCVGNSVTGKLSTAIGNGLESKYNNQFVIGKYNSNNSGNVFEIGYGSSSTKNNIFSVSTTGVTNTVSYTGSKSAIGNAVTASGDYSHAEGNSTKASGSYSHAEGENTIASEKASHAEGGSYYSAYDTNLKTFPRTVASNFGSHAEGYGSQASGIGAHAEGLSKATGNYSHAEGSPEIKNKKFNSCSVASGEGSHAEGYCTTAEGDQSHAEGASTLASGASSHAEGISTIAAGSYSHASGCTTIANYDGQFVLGSYNDNNENNIFEIGNGSYDLESNTTTRSNAFSVSKEGVATATNFIGKINGLTFTINDSVLSLTDGTHTWNINAE